MTIKFSYNPFNEKFFFGGESHSMQLMKHRQTKHFDDFIRGIIKDKKIYLRVYYPFDDIDTLNIGQLKQKSRELLQTEKKKLLKKVCSAIEKKKYDVIFNITNEDLANMNFINI